ncbi:MAG: BTAD domain-containing putative transcriptional regulator [Burkholderiaceae bacterium]|nr:BTAD domain-containing putative transcriptional regulator [Burkholderiaceae bacterium]
MAKHEDIRIELFGAPRVLRARSPLKLPARKSLAILACLALEGRVTRAKLATRLWEELDGEAARRNLRRELHRLRESGLDGAVQSDADQLHLAPGIDVDTMAFEADLAAGRTSQALTRYAGPLLDGFEVADAPGFDDWVTQQRERLAQRWRSAALAQAAQLKQAGDARGALALHQRLLADDALHEQHHRDVMRLHYLLGEREAALAQYERCRDVLRAELGLAPLPETVSLAERIRAAQSLAPVVGAPGPAPGIGRLSAPLVARERELGALRASRAAALLVIGDPGVGKSRLATEFLRDGGAPMVVRFTEIARQTPLFAFAEPLRDAWSQPTTRARLDALDPATKSEIARLLPALDADAARRQATDGPLPPERRARFLDALAQAVTAVAGSGLLLLDDLHWADEASAELAAALIRRRARSVPNAPRVIATARTHELTEAASLQQLVRTLERSGLMQRIALAPLDEAGVVALVQTMAGAEPGGASGRLFAQRLARSTGGNPFFLFESIRHLFDSGELQLDAGGAWSTRYDDTTADYEELPLPPSVQEVVIERVERLGAPARRVLEAAALTDAGFTLGEVQPATALSDFESVDGLERAVQAQLLLRDAADGAYRFAHELVRQALDTQLGSERRRLIHLKLAQSLQALHAPAARIAHHYESAGDGRAALPWRISAAEQAARVFGVREALAHTERALALGPDAAQAVTIRRQRIALQRILYDLDAMSADVEALADLVPHAGDSRLDLEVTVGRADVANLLKRHDEALRLAQSVRDDARWGELPIALRVKATSELCFALGESGRAAEAAAAWQALLDTGEPLAPAHEGTIRHGLGMTAWRLARHSAAEAQLRRAAELFTQTGTIELRARAYNLLAYLATHGGRAVDGIATLEKALADAEQAGLVAIQKSVLLNLVKLLAGRNDGARADTFLQRAVALLAEAGDPATRAQLASRESEVRRAQGRLSEALAAADRAIALFEQNRGGAHDLWPWYQRARLLWELGDNDGALEVYRRLPQSPAWLPRAEGALAFYQHAFRLPHAPAEVFAALDALERPPADDLMQQPEFDYYLARCELLLDRPAAAFARAEQLSTATFTLHDANLAALKLEAAARAGRAIAPWLEAAERLLPITPPLEALELRRALCAGLQRLGRDEDADGHRAAAQALLHQLADSLTDRPALQASFVHRNKDLLS